MKMRYSLLILVLFSITACSSGDGGISEITPSEFTQTTPSLFQTMVGLPSSTSDSSDVTLEPSLPSSTPYPTRDTSGIFWQDVPIMPEISERVYLIYEEGQKQGRSPDHFSVIGDCQSIPRYFLGTYYLGLLKPDPAESYLWDALGYFSSSIDHWSVTSRGGFTAASILNPIQADPASCKPGETPLTCEYRLNNPAYFFITLEIWDNPDTIERYEVYLRQILDYVIERGTIPILLTKADAAEVDDGHHVLNPAIVRVALEYDVPLVNFWKAAQYLDNIGIDPDRDGFHLSTEGYDLKSTLALRALYNIWQAVSSTGTGGEIGEITSTPTSVIGDIGSLLPEVVSPVCGDDCIYFATVLSRDGVISSQGVFSYDYSSQALTEILGEGFDLQDVSEDGQRLLVNRANYLYEVNLRDFSSVLLSDTFFYLGKQGAYWNSDDTEVILIDQSTPYETSSGAAYTLYPSPRDGEIYFKSGSCSSKDFCQPSGVYRFDSDLGLTSMESYMNLVFSPDGQLLAFLNPAAAVKENFFHIWYLLMEDPDNSGLTRRTIFLPNVGGFLIFPEVQDYSFSPGNDKLIILYDNYSEQFEKSMGLQAYLMDLSTGILYDSGKLAGSSASLSPRVVWSPEGDKLLYFLTDTPSTDQFMINIYQTDLLTGEKLSLYQPSVLANSTYFYITNIYWR
jgi:hypothetical protein